MGSRQPSAAQPSRTSRSTTMTVFACCDLGVGRMGFVAIARYVASLPLRPIAFYAGEAEAPHTAVRHAVEVALPIVDRVRASRLHDIACAARGARRQLIVCRCRAVPRSISRSSVFCPVEECLVSCSEVCLVLAVSCGEECLVRCG